MQQGAEILEMIRVCMGYLTTVLHSVDSSSIGRFIVLEAVLHQVQITFEQYHIHSLLAVQSWTQLHTLQYSTVQLSTAQHRMAHRLPPKAIEQVNGNIRKTIQTAAAVTLACVTVRHATQAHLWSSLAIICMVMPVKG